MPSFLLKELYMRIDKYISGCGYASRKDVKKLIKQGLVFIDGEVCKKPEEQTDENSIVEVDGERLIYREFVYLMLNKPQGCVSAVYDKKYPVVTEFVPDEYAHFEVYPVGRLDIDTEGLLILTNDGQFAHEMTSPKKKMCIKDISRCLINLWKKKMLKYSQAVWNLKSLPQKCKA